MGTSFDSGLRARGSAVSDADAQRVLACREESTLALDWERAFRRRRRPSSWGIKRGGAARLRQDMSDAWAPFSWTGAGVASCSSFLALVLAALSPGALM